MSQSENINDLAKALAAAQGQIEGAIKGKTNPHFRSNYADLQSVWDACREPLSKNNLAVVQTFEPSAEFKGVRLRTVLVHSSGQWIDGIIELPAAKVDAQGYGSAATYARRYALAAIVGVAPEDDDAEAASNRGKNAKADPQPSTEFMARDFEESLTADQMHALEQYATTMVKALAENDTETVIRNQRSLRALSAEEQSVGWKKLDSKQRRAITEIMAMASAAAAKQQKEEQHA